MPLSPAMGKLLVLILAGMLALSSTGGGKSMHATAEIPHEQMVQWNKLVKDVAELTYANICEYTYDNWKEFITSNDGDASVWEDSSFVEKCFDKALRELPQEQRELVKDDKTWETLFGVTIDWINIQYPGWTRELEESIEQQWAEDEYQKNDAAYWDHINRKIDEMRGK